MQAFHSHRGLVLPLDRQNVDTDAIIPKQFLKSIKRTGFGPHLFDEWRYLDHGEPGMDLSTRRPNPDFIFNQQRYQDASILLARRNFGCGSSREHAPWALQQAGFRAVLASSFADIFFNNCYKTGLLPIVISEFEESRLFDAALGLAGFSLLIDLPTQTVTTPDGRVFEFEIEDFRKHCLIEGLDEIGLTLAHRDEILEFEQRRLLTQPWLSQSIGMVKS
jgi:3-isopropylmalate/(R)-2-methylmalate dehydratase small subunit